MPPLDAATPDEASSVEVSALWRPIKPPLAMVEASDLVVASLTACMLHWRAWTLWALVLGSLRAISQAAFAGVTTSIPGSATTWAAWVLFEPFAAVSALRYMQAISSRARFDRSGMVQLNASILIVVATIELGTGAAVWTLQGAIATMGIGGLGAFLGFVLVLSTIDAFFLMAVPLAVLGSQPPLTALLSFESLSGRRAALFVTAFTLHLLVEALFLPPGSVLMGWISAVLAQAMKAPGYALAFIVYAESLREAAGRE